MAHLILGNDSITGNQVIANLADGVHPGKKVVEDPTPAGWKSRPLPKFRSIHIPGAPTAAFDDLMETNVDPLFRTMTRLVVDFLPSQAAEIALERKITIPIAMAVRRKANPLFVG